MDVNAKLVRGFKRHRDKAIKEKAGGWLFKKRAYDKIIQLIEDYKGEITGSENFKGIKGIGPKILDKIDTIIAEEETEII